MKTLAFIVAALLTGIAVGGVQDKTDYAALIKNLDSAERETRLDAINAIAELGPRAPKAVPPLVKILQEKDEELRLSAAIALGKIGKEAVEPVAKLLALKDDDTRYYALAALGWIG